MFEREKIVAHSSCHPRSSIPVAPRHAFLCSIISQLIMSEMHRRRKERSGELLSGIHLGCP